MDDRYVLFLDVLGFSELVLNNPHELLVRICDSELRQTALASTWLSSAFAGNTVATPFGIHISPQGVLNDVQQEHIQLHLMSDSLIAWTNDLEPNSLIRLVNFAAMYLAQTAMLGLPHRGAISKGSIKVLDLPLNGRPQSTAVGSGLVKAHRFEGGQEWMGCVVDPECFVSLPEALLTAWANEAGSTLTRYEVPYKQGAAFMSELVVDWRRVFKMLGVDGTLDYFREQFGRYGKTVTASVETKVRNTFHFYAAEK